MNNYVLFCLLFCFVAAGCSGNKKLSGKVMFDDGTPAPNGTVTFLSKNNNFMSRGEIQSDGSYKLSSAKTNDGIPPGEYKVYVSGISEMPEGPPSAMLLPILLCDPKYSDPETSGITCTIPAPGNRFDITIERRKTGRKK